MSKLKISPNLFLEVAELNRLVKFLKEDGYEQIIKSMLKSYGIVGNSNNDSFKVSAKAGSSNAVIVNPGIAFDSQLRAIKMDESLELAVDNTGSLRWIVLQYESTNYESGTVNITADGTLQGIGTKFTDVLRGQPNFPTKVKFNSSLNSEEYEVVSVSNDTSAILSGSFVAESNLQYSVVGAFTPGYEASEDNKNIYELDSYSITIVDSPDVPSLTADQFVLASIEFSGNGLIVTDRRSGYMFNSSNYSGVVPETNEIVSLLRVKKIQSNLLELAIEHGYTITSFEIISTSSSNIFRINSGSCNFLGSGNIPNSFFKNWILVNKNTLKKVAIDDNTNKDLFVSKLTDEILSGDVSEFAIVPPYDNLEYKVSYVGEESVVEKSFFLVSQDSVANKVLLSIPFGDITVELRYRMLSGEESTPWQKFSIAEYVNENGEKQSIGDSQFIITNNQPGTEIRNYS